MSKNGEKATLFVPGGGSYLDAENTLRLSERSRYRSLVAAAVFDPVLYEKAVFAGGYPGVTQNWDPSLTPPPEQREAFLMAQPLEQQLGDDASSFIYKEGESNHSIADAIASIEHGFFTPEEFNRHPDKTITLVAGALHGQRFRLILSRALAINPHRVQRIPMSDPFSEPEHPMYPRQYALPSIGKELAATAVTAFVLKDVEPGNLNQMKEAEERFIKIAKQLTK